MNFKKVKTILFVVILLSGISVSAVDFVSNSDNYRIQSDSLILEEELLRQIIIK